SFPHQRPGVSHTRLLLGPSVVMQTDVVTTVITMAAFLRPCYLICRAFTVKVMAILTGRGKPSLHMGEGSKHTLHNLYLVVVEIVFVEFAVDGFIKVCTAYSGENRQWS